MNCRMKRRTSVYLLILDFFVAVILLLLAYSEFSFAIYMRVIFQLITLISFLNLLLSRNFWVGIKLTWYLVVSMLLLKIFLIFPLILTFPWISLFGIYELFILFFIIFAKKCLKNPSRLFAKPDVSVAIIVIIFVFSYGFIGSLLLGNGFRPMISNPINALYFTGEVITTLGFGDIIPVTSVTKLFTISLSILGLGSFFGATTIIIAPVVYSRGKRVVSIMDRIESLSLKGYFIFIGHNNYLDRIIKELISRDELVVVIDKDESKREKIEEMGSYFEGSMRVEEIVKNFKLNRAKMIILGYQDDGLNLLNLNSILNIYGNEIKSKIVVILNDSSNYIGFKNQAGIILDISELVYDSMKDTLGKT